MKVKRIMVIAGETSGDALAAELVRKLNFIFSESQLPSPEFFGAGGAKMADAGVKFAVDMTQHAATGLSWLKKYGEFKKMFDQLVGQAMELQPELIVLVDFNEFNLRFARKIKRQVEKLKESGSTWSPKIVKFVSPQVWASRAWRAKTMERDIDLLLCLFAFEKEWFAKHAPKLRVEFVGHPILDRHLVKCEVVNEAESPTNTTPLVLLLPGSRVGEIRRHSPVMFSAAEKILAENKVRLRMVLPNQRLAEEAAALIPNLSQVVEVQTRDLTKSLSEATVAVASTGTVLLECACLGVPTVAMYQASWIEYQIGKRLVTVRFLSMPNILAGVEVFPEFIQDTATPENISRAALELLKDSGKREQIKTQLRTIVKSLGEPGAANRAAQAIVKLMG